MLSKFLLAGASAAGGAFPVMQLATSGYSGAFSTTHTIVLPTSIAAGEYLIAAMCSTTAATFTWPGGWTELYDATYNSGGNGFTAGYKVAAGSDANPTLTLSSGGQCSYLAARVSGAGNIEVGGTVTAALANPDPSSFSPSWGSAKTLWMPVFSETGGTLTSSPSSYTTIGSNAGFNLLGWAQRSLEAASEDAGAFVTSGANPSVATMIAVKTA